MEDDEDQVIIGLKDKIFKIYSDFLTRVANFEELVILGSKLLTDFQQGLEFLQRPPVNNTSKLVGSIIKANETKRLKSYVEGGCINTHDSVQHITKLGTCILGLQDHLIKAKTILNELECLMDKAASTVQTANESSPHLLDRHYEDALAQQATTHGKEEMKSSGPQKPDLTDYAALVGIIYSMLKQDYLMQERIVNALELKTSSGQLESYTVMWSLRPYINEEIMHQATLIP